MFPQNFRGKDNSITSAKKDPMLDALTQLYFSKGGIKKIVKQEPTQVDSAFSIKTPEITPTKQQPTSKLSSNSQTLFKKKTERLSSLLSQDLSKQQNLEPKKNVEVVRKVTEKLRISVSSAKENDKTQGVQRSPSILRSTIRKSFARKDNEEKSQLTEEITQPNKESQQLIRKVTQEIKRTSVSLRRRTYSPTAGSLLLVTPSGNEKNIVAVEVSTSYSNLNSTIGGILIDDNTKKLFVWRGKNVGLQVKSQCADFALKYKAFEKPNYKIQIEDEGVESEEFIKVIGGKCSFGQETISLKIERLQYEDKIVTRVPIGNDILTKKSLNGLHMFYITTGWNSFLWCGLKTSKNAREACAKLCGTIKNGKLTILFQTHESLLFKQLFSDWVEPVVARTPIIHNVNGNFKKELPPFNVAVLFNEIEYKEKKVPEFSPNGVFKKFKVENVALKLMDEKDYFVLKSEECYVFHYIYPWKNLFKHAIFFWLGRNASILHRGKAAALTVDYVEKNKLDSVQVRVVEGGEQREFVAMQKGGIVIKKGINKEKYEIYEIRKERGTDGVRMIQVNGNICIDSNRSYLICENGKGIYVEGKYSVNGQLIERIAIRSGIIDELQRNETMESIQKYKEFKEFNKIYNVQLPEFPHAFTISACTGTIEWEGIYELNLQTFDDQRIIVVTFNGKVYFCVKEEVGLGEIVKLLKTITDYVECAQIRNIQLKPLFVRPGEEPEDFKRLFLGNQQLKRGNEVVEEIGEIFKQLTRKYSLAELQKKPKLLNTVSCGSLETFLDDTVFEKVFGMTRELFAKQPKWRQKDAKLRVGLW